MSKNIKFPKYRFEQKVLYYGIIVKIIHYKFKPFSELIDYTIMYSSGLCLSEVREENLIELTPLAKAIYEK